MSLQFSNTTTQNGIIQRIERTLGFNPADISGNTTRLAQFTGDINVTMDEVVSIIIQADGRWQWDDTNHTDYPIIITDLVSGQRDYPFLTDGSGNLILDVFRVMVKDEIGIYHEIQPVDQQTANNNRENTDTIIDGQNKSGVPTRYDKTANAVFLDLIPNYNSEDGLKLFINRESSYFTTSDTTKKAGFAGIFHEYLVLKPAYNYARDKGLQSLERLEKDVLAMRQEIQRYYGMRERDTPRRLQANVENTK